MPESESSPSPSPSSRFQFADVPADAPWAWAVQFLASKGLLSGYPDPTQPDTPSTPTGALDTPSTPTTTPTTPRMIIGADIPVTTDRLVNFLARMLLYIQEQDLNLRDMALRQVYTSARRSVVAIQATPLESAYMQTIGSGVVVHRRPTNTYDYVITNHHVVANAPESGPRAVVTYGMNTGGMWFNVVKEWPDLDLALLECPTTRPFTEVASIRNDAISGPILTPSQVLILGQPMGQRDTATLGVISAAEQVIKYYRAPQYLLPTDAAVNPGNSGGGMFDMQGKLVGIPSVKLASPGVEGMAYAIPSRVVLECLREAGIQV